MPSNDCIWNQDLTTMKDCCIWKRPEQACVGKVETCDTYQSSGTKILVKTCKPTCTECVSEDESIDGNLLEKNK